MEQGRGEDDQKEAYREDLMVIVVSITVRRIMDALLCASARRTKDSPMMVLMPAMLGMPDRLHGIVVGMIIHAGDVYTARSARRGDVAR